MHAAVVTSFDAPPKYQWCATPVASGEHEVVVSIVAAGLHPRVRSQANGSHYTSGSTLPLIPGVDGVGRTSDGELRYFVLPDSTVGSMAEQTVIDLRRSVVLPDSADPVLVAAAMNPAMSSWIALRHRIDFTSGDSVLVLGATGSAGQMAVQVARHLGAGRILAAGRDPERLAVLSGLGADEVVSLDGPPDDVADRIGRSCSEADVVIDYLWGRPAADTMIAIVRSRKDPSRPLSWVQIGSVAGPTAEIASAALRACSLQIVGSGQGSVRTSDIVAALPEIAERIVDGSLRVNALPIPLTDVEQAWSEPSRGDERLVIVP